MEMLKYVSMKKTQEWLKRRVEKKEKNNRK